MWCCLWPHGCSGRRRARPPARLGDLTSFGAVPRSPPVPSGPSGALHTSGAWCARGRRPAREPSAPRVSLGASTRCPAWPRSYLSNFARNSPAACSNIEFTSLELQRFRMVLKSDRGKLCATLVSAGPPATFCAAAGPASRSPPMPSGALLWCARCGEEALFWIGTALLDSLLTYPDCCFLSSLVVCASPVACLLRGNGGFCAMRSLLVARRRRVGGLDGAIPPFGVRLV